MSILRAAKLVHTLYHRLIEEGLGPRQAMFIVQCLSTRGQLTTLQESTVGVLAVEIGKAYSDLHRRHRILTCDWEDESSAEQQRTDDVLGFLEAALGFDVEHKDPRKGGA